MAGPTIEGTYTATASGVTTWDITGVVIPSGLTDGLLIVGNSYEYGNNGNESNVTGVQIDPGGANQADFTKINNASVFGSYGNESSLWYLADANIPPAGTYTIRITTNLPSGYAYTVYAASGCYVLSGAKQTGIPDAQNTQTATNSTGVTTSLTTVAADTLLLGSYSQGDNNAPTANSGQTVRWDLASGTSRGTSSYKQLTSAGAESLGYTHASSNRVAHAIAALAASGAATKTIVTSLDSLVQKQGVLLSAQADAALQKKGLLKATSLDAALLRTVIRETQLDSIVKAVDVALVTSLDAALQKRGVSLQTSLDALLQKGMLRQTQVDALLQAVGVARQASLDAALQKLGVAVSASLDAAVQRAGVSVATSLDAVLQDSGGATTRTVSTLVDALLQRQGVTVSTSVDAALKRVGVQLSAAVDAALRKEGLSLQAQADAVLKKVVGLQANLDSALMRQGVVVSASLDAMLRRVGILKSVSLDAYLILRRVLSVQLDAYLGKAGILVTTSLDAFLRIPTGQWNPRGGSVSGSWSGDAGVSDGWVEDSGVGNSWS